MRKVKQQELADRLGLSRTTVSRCFTNHPKINPETRAKVFQLAAELGYQYNAQRGGRARGANVAVLVAVPENRRDHISTAGPILSGISEQAAKEGLALEFHHVDPGGFLPGPRSRRILPGVASSDWCGIVLVFPFAETAARNLSLKFPLISLLEDYETEGIDCIDTDHGRGISALMAHLYNLGHRRIGFLTWRYPDRLHWVERRFGAYVESLYRLGLSFDPRLALNVHPEETVPAEALAERVIRGIKRGVRAWMCAADHQAVDLIRILLARGVRVPEDVSVTGYDGIPVPAAIPALTSIQLPFPEIGHSAIVSLRRRMLDPASGRRHVLVSGRLITGATTAPPAR